MGSGAPDRKSDHHDPELPKLAHTASTFSAREISSNELVKSGAPKAPAKFLIPLMKKTEPFAGNIPPPAHNQLSEILRSLQLA